MLKIKLIGGEAIADALSLLLPEIDAQLCSCPNCANPDLAVTVKETEEDILRVTLDGKEVGSTLKLVGDGKTHSIVVTM